MIGRRTGRGGLCVLILAWSLASLPAGASAIALAKTAAAAAGLVGVRAAAVTAAHLTNRADAGELALTLSRTVDASAFTLSGPDRVILDLPQVAFAMDPASLVPASPDLASPDPAGAGPRASGRRGRRGSQASSGLIASVRYGLLAPGRSRVVVTLAEPARVVSAAVMPGAGGAAVLTLKLARTDRASFDAGVRPPQPAASLAAPAGGAVPAAAASAVTGAAARPVIVIDPGHGGPDTGAERNGLVEKDLTLDFARALAARLEAGGRYAVVMTRASDVFIPLSERVAIARRSGAALMISVHADTLPEGSRDAADVSGATVYTVSDRASDAYAATVAAKENAADAAAGVAGQGETADVADILFDLTRQETRAYSHVFARTLVNYWKIAGRLNRNPQRSAGFVVLKAPDVPSVLVELGYLSSAADAASFLSEEWRAKATGRMAEAVEAYFAEQHAGPQRRLSAGLGAGVGDPASPGPR